MSQDYDVAAMARRENDSEGVRFIMKYTVVRIDEDIDFGCEERAVDAPVMAVVTLKGEDREEMRLRQPMPDGMR